MESYRLFVSHMVMNSTCDKILGGQATTNSRRIKWLRVGPFEYKNAPTHTRRWWTFERTRGEEPLPSDSHQQDFYMLRLGGPINLHLPLLGRGTTQDIGEKYPNPKAAPSFWNWTVKCCANVRVHLFLTRPVFVVQLNVDYIIRMALKKIKNPATKKQIIEKPLTPSMHKKISNREVEIHTSSPSCGFFGDEYLACTGSLGRKITEPS